MNDVFTTCLYRSPSQNRQQFQSLGDFLDIFMNNINSFNPAVSIITGCFSKKGLKWCSFHSTDNIWKVFDTITSTVGYTQFVDKPIHSTKHSFSCVDFICIIVLYFIIIVSQYNDHHHNNNNNNNNNNDSIIIIAPSIIVDSGTKRSSWYRKLKN